MLFEASGSRQGLEYAIDLAAANGTIALLGFQTDGITSLNAVTLKALRLVGSIGGTGDFPDVLEFLTTHQDRVRQLITATYPVSEATAAFTEANRPGNHLKTQIIFNPLTTEELNTS